MTVNQYNREDERMANDRLFAKKTRTPSLWRSSKQIIIADTITFILLLTAVILSLLLNISWLGFIVLPILLVYTFIYIFHIFTFAKQRKGDKLKI